jgi:hypothetical protein
VALRESAVLYARRGFANIGVTPSKDPTRCDPNFLSENDYFVCLRLRYQQSRRYLRKAIIHADQVTANNRVADLKNDRDVEDVMAKDNVFAQAGTAIR